MVGRDPVAIEILEQIRSVLHADSVIIERRAVSDEKLCVRVRRGIVEVQQALQDFRRVQL